jgi:hypothetical protein
MRLQVKFVGGVMYITHNPYITHGYITHGDISGHIRVGGSRVRRWAKFKKAGAQTYPDTPYEHIPIVSSAIQEVLGILYLLWPKLPDLVRVLHA